MKYLCAFLLYVHAYVDGVIGVSIYVAIISYFLGWELSEILVLFPLIGLICLSMLCIHIFCNIWGKASWSFVIVPVVGFIQVYLAWRGYLSLLGEETSNYNNLVESALIGLFIGVPIGVIFWVLQVDRNMANKKGRKIATFFPANGRGRF